jgi:hypothetical protein
MFMFLVVIGVGWFLVDVLVIDAAEAALLFPNRWAVIDVEGWTLSSK